MNTNHEPAGNDESLAREIVEENRRYDRLKGLVKRSLAKSRRDKQDLQLVVKLLEEFRDEVALHFTLEIASDTHQEAIQEAPRLAHKVEALMKEQGTLYTEICEMADLLQRHREAGKERVPEAVIKRWKHFNHRLKEHDAAERDLIFDAYYQDLGTGD